MKPQPNFRKLVLNPDHIFGLKESLEWAIIYFKKKKKKNHSLK